MQKYENIARNQGHAQGLAQGLAQGHTQGLAQGRSEGKLEMLISLVKDGVLTKQDAGARAGLTEQEFAALLNAPGDSSPA